VAEFLAGNSSVGRVYYPGLKSHPQHELARRQQDGFGGMVSFEVNGGIGEVNHVLRSVRVFSLAGIVGGIESLIDHPASMTHASMHPELRAKAGITERSSGFGGHRAHRRYPGRSWRCLDFTVRVCVPSEQPTAAAAAVPA